MPRLDEAGLAGGQHGHHVLVEDGAVGQAHVDAVRVQAAPVLEVDDGADGLPVPAGAVALLAVQGVAPVARDRVHVGEEAAAAHQQQDPDDRQGPGHDLQEGHGDGR